MNRKNFSRDNALLWSLRSCAAISGGVLIVIVFFVFYESIPAFKQVGISQLAVDPSWHPTESNYNLVPMVVGTLAAAFGSLLVTAPLGIGSALFLRFYAPKKIAWCYRRVIEILAGIPSVVYGLWGISVIVPLIASVSPIGQGESLLAGILILSMMTVPTVIVAADSAIGSVSAEHVRSAAALGLGRRAIAWSIVLPAARSGIATGIILQVGRAIGETMAVLMICGNIVQIPGSLFQPVRTLTATIAMEMGYADQLHRSVLFVAGLILLGIIGATMMVAEWTSKNHVRVQG